MQIEEFAEQFYRIMNKYTLSEKQPFHYGNDTLYRSEIHTIDVIGRNENINITALSKLQGITKGAVSQMVTKLCQKGMVKKEPSPETENEVVLNLTSKGKSMFDIHAEHHKTLYKNLSKYLAKLSSEDLKIIGDILAEFEKFFDKK